MEYVLTSGPGTIETDYLEWKSSFDLGKTRYRAATAKQILGFANRDPDRAVRNARGYAYLLIGVSFFYLDRTEPAYPIGGSRLSLDLTEIQA